MCFGEPQVRCLGGKFGETAQRLIPGRTVCFQVHDGLELHPDPTTGENGFDPSPEESVLDPGRFKDVGHELRGAVKERPLRLAALAGASGGIAATMLLFENSCGGVGECGPTCDGVADEAGQPAQQRHRVAIEGLVSAGGNGQHPHHRLLPQQRHTDQGDGTNQPARFLIDLSSRAVSSQRCVDLVRSANPERLLSGHNRVPIADSRIPDAHM